METAVSLTAAIIVLVHGYQCPAYTDLNKKINEFSTGGGKAINKNGGNLKRSPPFYIKLPRLVDFRNWLMTSGEVDILKMLMKELRFAEI